MPHQNSAMPKRGIQRRPPHNSDLLERDPSYRLEYLTSGIKPHLFSAVSDPEALKHVADILQIPYPLVEREFARQGGKSIYRDGKAKPIYPPQKQ